MLVFENNYVKKNGLTLLLDIDLRTQLNIIPNLTFCGTAGQNIQKGYRRTKTLGLRKIRLCKKCKRKFTPINQKLINEEQVAKKE